MDPQDVRNNSSILTNEHPSASTIADAWREVGVELENLGSRLAQAIQRSWAATGSKQESRETMRRLGDDLRAAADRVDQVIEEAGTDTREQRETAMRATRIASEQSLEEARMLTAATLRKLNKQLDYLVIKLERDRCNGR